MKQKKRISWLAFSLLIMICNVGAEAGDPIRDSVRIGGKHWSVSHLPGVLACDSSDGVIYHSGLSQVISVGPRFNSFGGATRAIIAPNGDYLAFVCGDGYYQGSEGKVNDAYMMRSKDNGHSWSKGEHPWMYEDASQHLLVPYIDPDIPERIYVMGNESRSRAHAAPIVYRYSDDNGYSWSDAVPVSPVNDPDHPGGPVHSRGCVMPDGTWLWGTYYRGEGLHGDTQYVLRSEDKGKTWMLYPEAHPGGWKHKDWNKFMEGTIIPTGGKKATLYLRAPGGHMYESRTTDGGISWSKYGEAPGLIHPDAPPMVFKLSDNETLISFIHNRYDDSNPNHNHLDRGELWFSLSENNGKSWSEPRFITAQAKMVDKGSNSVHLDVSYVDFFADGKELNLFVGNGQKWTTLIKFNENDLDKFYTKEELISKHKANCNQ